MATLEATATVNATQLYDEIVTAVPALAPTPTGPDGKLEAKFIVEQTPEKLLIHVPDEVDLSAVQAVLDAHNPQPVVTVDPVADAQAVVEQKAAEGDPLAQAVLTLLGG